jgi:ATP-dependent Clp protease ATP-binding subunit ClpB
MRQFKAEIEEARVDEQQALRRGDLARAAEITHGRIPDLEKMLADESAHLAEIQQDRKMLTEEVCEEDIAGVVAKWTGIPVAHLLAGERDKLVRAEAELGHRVVGQDEAIKAVANAVRRSRAGLQDPDRPLGSFIFLGPTGVGKTELARTLAAFLFNSANAMVRIDMSEFMEKHSVSRLIGAPPGYVGYDEGGYLTEAVRRRPYSVVLFDEIEKAHPDVFNILLQILDDGRLTDGQGRTVDFKNTILIMTSNLGSQMIMELGEKNRQEAARRVDEILHNSFKPEFLNRIDETIIFHSLDKGHLSRIVDIQLDLLKKRLTEQKLEIVLTDAAREYLIEVGYDPTFGARPLKRAIQRHIQDRLAMQLLEGFFAPGDRILVDRGDGELTFAKD